MTVLPALGLGRDSFGALIDVGVDELLDRGLIDVIELQDAAPGRHGNRRLHVRPRGQNELDVALANDLLEPGDGVLTDRVVVLDDDAAVLEVVDLHLGRDRLVVDAPRGGGAVVRT